MNELMIVFHHNWIYFSTSAQNITDALLDLEQKCEAIGLNTDNMCPERAELRGPDGAEIESRRLIC